MTTHGGTPGDDHLTGAEGDDFFLWSPGRDTLDGGLRVTTARNQVLDIHDEVQRIEFLDATPTGAELMAQASGPITGTAGDDILYGTAGADLIEALAGNDWILPGGTGQDTVDGGDGWDMVSFAGYGPGGISAYLGNAIPEIRTAGGTTEVRGIEGVTGTSQSDWFRGGAGNDFFRGLGGRDRFFGGDGADYFSGGGGSDWAHYDSDWTQPGVHVSLLRGRGWAGEADGDRLAGIENIRAGRGHDTLTGDHGANILDGGYGDDLLTGLGGDDYLLGGHGTDVARYFGSRADYQVVTSDFRTEVTHLNGGWEGHDVLAHVEILRFADGDLIL